MKELPCIIGLIRDGGGNLYNNYQEDSYVVSEEYISATIKSNYGIDKSFWVLVKETNDKQRED